MALLGCVDLLPPAVASTSTFLIIFDIGSSLAIISKNQKLGGLANELNIEGIGTIK